MKTLRWLLLSTLMFAVVWASAEPARTRQGSTTTPPAASTTRGPNQSNTKAPAGHPGAVTTPQPGRTPAAAPATPSARGGVWGSANDRPQATTPTKAGGKSPAARDNDQYTRDTRSQEAARALLWGHGVPQTKSPSPSAPARRDDGRPAEHGYTPAPSAPHTPASPAVHNERDRRDDHDSPSRGHVSRPQPPAHRPSDWDQPYRGRHEGQWKYAPLVGMIVRAFLPSNPRLLGAVVVADNDTFLGVISRDANDPDSLTNPYGRFGSPWSPDSIWNPDARYGREDGRGSPWNPYATKPPKVYDGNEFRGYLTANTQLYPRIDPEWLRSYLELPRW
jgi:hypothetical protein